MHLWRTVTDRVLEDTSTSGTKFSPLDGLRGIAVLVVFLSHSSAFRQRLTPWTSFHGTGHLGVYLFFVLSGFLLTWSLLGASRIRFGAFYLRRFFRIAPLYYLVLAGVFLAQTLGNSVDLYNLHVTGGAQGFLRHLAFFQGDSVFWTIAAEFEFYFILPLIVLALVRWGGRAALIFAFLAIAYGAWYVLIELGAVDPGYTLKVAKIAHHSQYLDVFLWGILGAWLFRQEGFSSVIETHRRLMRGLASGVACFVIAISLMLVAETFFGVGRLWRNEQVWWQTMGWPEKFGPHTWSLFFGPAFAVIALMVLDGNTWFRRVLDLHWLRMIGVTGFSWYLIHFPILRMVNAIFGFAPTAGGAVAWTWREPVAFATSFVVTFIAAVVLYMLIEKPFMNFSRKLILRPQGISA